MPQKNKKTTIAKHRPIAKKNRVIKKPTIKKSGSDSKKTTLSTPVKDDGTKTASIKNMFSALRGMKDILPVDERFWRTLYHGAEDIATAYNFHFIETPILEHANVFIRSIGKGTDVIDKEMYVFEDRDGMKIALRPEGTAGIVRAYISHGFQTQPQPVKVWYYESMFRHDRPQAGRYRQFHQFGCESFGIRDAVIDAELISVAYHFINDLGIDIQVKMNSIGTVEDRQKYIVELVTYLRQKRSYLCEDCKRRINKNPLRTFDCKQEQCQQVKAEAPQIIDWLSEDSKKFFMKVLEYLDELEIPYILDTTLVRGLNYYTDTVFEIYEEDENGSQSALGGGGRYDLLVEQLGGLDTPGSGFSIGLERVVSVMKRREQASGKLVGVDPYSSIYFAQLGEQGRRRGLLLIERLRLNGLVVHHNFGKSSLRVQLESANKFGATHTVILGQKEVQDGTIIIRDMESGIQETIDQKKLVHELSKLSQ